MTEIEKIRAKGSITFRNIRVTALGEEIVVDEETFENLIVNQGLEWLAEKVVDLNAFLLGWMGIGYMTTANPMPDSSATDTSLLGDVKDYKAFSSVSQTDNYVVMTSRWGQNEPDTNPQTIEEVGMFYRDPTSYPNTIFNRRKVAWEKDPDMVLEISFKLVFNEASP